MEQFQLNYLNGPERGLKYYMLVFTSQVNTNLNSYFQYSFADLNQFSGNHGNIYKISRCNENIEKEFSEDIMSRAMRALNIQPNELPCVVIITPNNCCSTAHKMNISHLHEMYEIDEFFRTLLTTLNSTADKNYEFRLLDITTSLNATLYSIERSSISKLLSVFNVNIFSLFKKRGERINQ